MTSRWRRVGFLPEHFRFHEWLTASEFLALQLTCIACQLSAAIDASPSCSSWLALLRTPQRLRQFSKGMLQRIGLAQALLNEPELVILDEPTGS